jgi:hypothetical protein
VLLFAAHHLARTEVIDINGAEQWLLVVRTERTESLQVVVQLTGDILEINLCVDVEDGLYLFGLDMFLHIFLETAAELRNILP